MELTEGDGPIVRRGDTVTVNYHGVVWGKDTQLTLPASTVVSPPVSASAWDRSSRARTSLCRAITWVRVWWFPIPQIGYGSRGIPQAGIGGEDTLVYVIDIIFHPLTIGQHMTNAGVIAGVLS